MNNFKKDSEQDAAKYIENKRPIYPVKYNQSNYNNEPVASDDTPLEIIDLCSESDTVISLLLHIQ